MELRAVEVDLDQGLWTHEVHVRSPGLHLTTVLSEMEKQYGQDRGKGWEDSKLRPYRVMGWLWERALFDNILKGEGVERLGEFKKDGIKFTPDALRGGEVLIEAKATYRSMPDSVEELVVEHDVWMMQIKCNLYGLGLEEFELWVAWFMGNYRDIRGPHITRYEGRIRREEGARAWKMMKRFAEKRGWIGTEP